jgi:hypothetical protein
LQHIELADEIAEDDCAVAGHLFSPSWAKSEKNNRICPIDSPASSGFV